MCYSGKIWIVVHTLVYLSFIFWLPAYYNKGDVLKRVQFVQAQGNKGFTAASSLQIHILASMHDACSYGVSCIENNCGILFILLIRRILSLVKTVVFFDFMWMQFQSTCLLKLRRCFFNIININRLQRWSFFMFRNFMNLNCGISIMKFEKVHLYAL